VILTATRDKRPRRSCGRLDVKDGTIEDRGLIKDWTSDFDNVAGLKFLASLQDAKPSLGLTGGIARFARLNLRLIA
jgi:hypothetical protein